MSSGLDSTTNLFAAHRAGWEILMALTIDYGQRAASKEIERAKLICDQLDVPHRVLELGFFRDFGASALVDRAKSVPTGVDVAIDDFEVSKKTARSVWVPNRNGILLNIAAGFAESLGAGVIVPGFNKEEAATFPDNTPAFMAALTNAFGFSTSNGVKVECFTADLDKSMIAFRAKELGVPFHLIWPCYLDEEMPCGRCESCQRDKRAYRSVGLEVERYFRDAT